MRTEPPNPPSARVRLCGALSLEVGGRGVGVRGRQARLILAHLAWNRHRAVARDELIELLWPIDPPAAPGDLLRPVLSRLRSALGAGTLEGGAHLSLRLGEEAWVDVEAARAELRRAEGASERTAWVEVCRAGQAVLDVTAETFLVGDEHPWVEERRREVEELRMRAMELTGAAGVALGGSGIGVAERCARELVATAPFRESGHLVLMRVLEARGDVAEALRTYDALRVRLRDELGTAPGAPLRDLHTRLLSEDRPVPADATRDEHKLVTVVAADGELAEGTVVSGPGGAVAVFGVPRAREDDAERAVRAALALGARAAVVSGEVLVRGGTPAGDPVDRAATLLEATPAGVVLVDDFTARLTEHAVEYERSGLGSRALRLQPARAAASTSFVGRHYELTVLERLHRTVVEEERPRLLLIVGDAGAGKSRLVDELLRRIEASHPGARIHAGRCPAHGDGLTYWPLRELLWSIAGIALDDNAAVAAAKLRTLLDRTVAEPERTAQALAASAGIVLAGNPLERLEPESVAEEVALAWPRFASGLADTAPAVLVIEDLHWAEAALLEMVEQLVARSAGPLLVVGTARPELLEGGPGFGRSASQLALEPLTTADVRSLVAELLPDAAPALRERVVSVAEGNPFFAEEVAHHLRDQGAAPPGMPIPTSVRAVLAARLDALPAAEKRALQDAAVVGRSFWASSLPASGPAPLRALEERGLVVTRPISSLPGQTELWFRHALIREVAYRSIPEAQLRAAHAHAGDWLARLTGDRREEFVELLAHHYERAAAGGEPEAMRAIAVTALIDAGQAARRRSAGDDAVRFADRALELARTDDERVRALELRARALHDALRADEALAAYMAALELARDDPTVGRLRANAVLLCSRYSGAFARRDWTPWAIATVDQGLAHVATDEATFEVGALLIGRAAVPRWSDASPLELVRARNAAERAIAIGEAIGSTRLVSHALEGLGWRHADTGFCEAGSTADRMLDVMGRMTDRAEAAETAVMATFCLVQAGRFDEAVATAAEAVRATRTMSPHRQLHAAAAQTVSLTPQGRFADLADATARAVEFVSAEGERTCSLASLAVAGHALARFESLDAAAGERAAALVDATSRHHAESAFRYLGIELLRPFVGLERTRAQLVEAEAPPGLVDLLHLLRAQLQVAALDDGEPIAPLADRARELARQACAPALAWIADWAEAIRAGSLDRALRATAALDAHRDCYTAARLEVDALVRLPDAERVAATLARLEQMGARASAAELAA